MNEAGKAAPMKTIRLTAAQATVRFLAQQMTEIDGTKVRLFGGVFAIFGHGNVAAMGEALYAVRDVLPTYRSHNEQAMALSAIAYAKASRRRRMMVCTSSIGPGATNMITAAATASVNRLPVLFLPGDVFASHRPDPVLQQVEDFGDGTISANDCFKPVSRYFDRITRPEQIVPALSRAIAVLTDPAECGPVTLAFCQDVQAEAYDYPASFFEERLHRARRQGAGSAGAQGGRRRAARRQKTVRRLRRRRPLFAGRAGTHRLLPEIRDPGGRDAGRQVGDARRPSAVARRRRRHRHQRGQQARRGGRCNSCGRHAARRFHHRLVGAVPESRAALHRPQRAAVRRGQASRPAAGRRRPRRRSKRWTPRSATGRRRTPGATSRQAKAEWEATPPATPRRPTRSCRPTPRCSARCSAPARRRDIVVCAAGGLPGELHKHWRPGRRSAITSNTAIPAWATRSPAVLGVKLAQPDREVVVSVGDGSYLMMNSEIATSIMLGVKLIIVVNDNRGFGCINRLQRATGGAPFNNLLRDARHEAMPDDRFRRPRAHPRRGGGQGELDRRTRGGVQAARPRSHPGDRHRHRSEARPTPAAPGGMSRCRKSRAREGRRRAPRLRRGAGRATRWRLT